MDLCMPSGDIVRSTFAKSNLNPIPQLYKTLRKSSWGGLFPVGAGDEDYSSLLMKEAKKPLVGFSAERVKSRKEREIELLAKQLGKAENSRALDIPKSFSDLRDESNIDSRDQRENNSTAYKSRAPPDLIPGKDVPFHSTYLRSPEYVNREKTRVAEARKIVSKKMKSERKEKRLSSMAAAFRRRQEEKKTTGEIDEE